MSKTTVTDLELIFPLFVTLPRVTVKDKRISLNMNTYRNLDFHTNNNAKKNFKESIREQLENIIIKTPVKISWQIYKPTKRRLDKGNVYSMAAKYLYDAISDYGCWVDDNDDYIKQELIKPTIYDKNNGRIVVKITSLES